MIYDAELGKASKTHSEYMFQRLSADIIHCRFEPGAKLTSDSLRKRYDVGISPLREALSRLSAVGLVTQVGQRGFRVAPISPEDLIDLTRVRIFVECTAIRLSLGLGNADWEAEILAAAHRFVDGPGPRRGRLREARP
jgi:DNA-binding GntR family transcriptional regulator